MPNSAQHSKSVWVAFGAKTHSAWLLVCALALLGTAAEAQTFTVLHNFTGGPDGGQPWAGLTLDGAGNLYGMTLTGGGLNGNGTVYKLPHRDGHWTFATLYNAGGYGGVTIGPNSSLYGTCAVGPSGGVFNLQPPQHFTPNLLAPWRETTLYSPLPASQTYSGVVFDLAGNIYGTTLYGGSLGAGTVYEVSPSNGGWTGTVIHNFGNGTDGDFPYASLLIDAAGNLYGTTLQGGAYGDGTVFELSPSVGGWTESILYSFTGGADGGDPYGGLIFDSSGNLYGATAGLYTGGQGGSVFKLTPSGNTWIFSVLYSFANGGDECGPRGTPAIDAAGNLYDTTYCYPENVFKLTNNNGDWTYTSLHQFTGGDDGEYPVAGVTLDANDNLYGTASGGGAYNQGVVWEITP